MYNKSMEKIIVTERDLYDKIAQNTCEIHTSNFRDSRVIAYECGICHVREYVKLFSGRRPNHYRVKGTMANHVKSHFQVEG